MNTIRSILLFGFCFSVFARAADIQQATVPSAEYYTELVAEGGMLHRGEVMVEHGAAAEYAFKLPEGSKLLPRTPLFVHRLIWQLQLPSEYQATALEGNVVIDAGDAHGGSVRLSKQIYDDEAPIASLYYTRRDLER